MNNDLPSPLTMDLQYGVGGVEHLLIIIIIGFLAHTLLQKTTFFRPQYKKILYVLLIILALAYVTQYILSLVTYFDTIRPAYTQSNVDY